MKEATRKGIIGISTVLSLYFILMLTVGFVAQVRNATPPFAGSGFVVLLFFTSPLVLLLALFSTYISCSLSTRLWIKVSLATINGLGALVAGYLTVILVGLAMIGPINPG